jgi:predicted RNase H-like HicB family nuclease
MNKKIKIIIERHPDGFVAYPLGLKGVVIAQGDTYEEALADCRSAIAFHIETFGDDSVITEPTILDVTITEADIAVL